MPKSHLVALIIRLALGFVVLGVLAFFLFTRLRREAPPQVAEPTSTPMESPVVIVTPTPSPPPPPLPDVPEVTPPPAPPTTPSPQVAQRKPKKRTVIVTETHRVITQTETHAVTGSATAHSEGTSASAASGPGWAHASASAR